MRGKCLAQEHNTMSRTRTRTQTQTTRFRVECTNHEATASLTCDQLYFSLDMVPCLKKSTLDRRLLCLPHCLLETPENSYGFNRIRTHELCNGGALPIHLSHNATQLGAGHFVGLMCSCERTLCTLQYILLSIST